MKKIALIAALAAALASSFGAHAATATGTFDVTVNLTPVCQLTTTAGTNITFNYTSFGAAQSPSSTFSVRCTNTLPYAVTLDGAGFGGTTTVLGLDYSLTLSAPVGGGTGTGLAQTYTINGSMASGQSGTCANANQVVCSNTTARTLTITY